MKNDLRTKIGQMVFTGFRGTQVNDSSAVVRSIKQGHVGGLWLVDNDSPMGATIGNIGSSEQVKSLTSELQRHSEIPLFLSIDAEGGEIIRLRPKYGFPSFLSAEELGARDDVGQTRENARGIARLLRELGFNFNFTPVVDLNKNPRNPAIGMKKRSYSADPEIVSRHAAAVIEEHRALQLATILKHYPGHGSPAGDTHEGFVDVTKTWGEDELVPYRSLIQRGLCDAIMTAHVTHRTIDPTFPATLSPQFIERMLRQEMGFDGVVIVDDFNMKAISDHYSFGEAVQLAVAAGADIILQGNVAEYREDAADIAYEALLKLVRDGAISEDRIDQSHARIMRLKKQL